MKSESLFNAIRSEDEQTVASLLAEHPELLNEKDQRGSTPLLLATYYGHLGISKKIIAAGADLNAKDASGNTALMGVCFKGYVDVAKLLIDEGADVNVQNFNGATALIYAATFNQKELVELLLERGANPDLRDSRDLKAEDHARMQGLDQIENLLKHATP